MSNFEVTLINAKANDENALLELLKMYSPLIRELSCVDGVFDDELHQVLMIKFWTSIQNFKL